MDNLNSGYDVVILIVLWSAAILSIFPQVDAGPFIIIGIAVVFGQLSEINTELGEIVNGVADDES